jgi:MFS family permease
MIVCRNTKAPRVKKMTEKKGERPSRGYAYYVFVLLFLLYMFDYIDRLVVVSLFPYIKSEWGLTDTQCGMLVSAVYWSILLFTFPVSILIDRWSRKKSIGIMALLWSLATAVCALTRSFTQLFAARTVIGVGEAGYAPGGTAMISGIFPEEMRARILGIWNASIPMGSAIGIILGGVIAENFGWRHAFGIVAIPGLIVAIMFFWVRDYQTVALVRSDDTGVKVNMSRMDVIRQFTRNGSLIFTNLGFAASAFVTTSLMSWLPTYYHRFELLDMSRAGVKSGSIMFMAIIGAPLGGFLADKWYRKVPKGRLLFPSLSSAVTSLLILGAFLLFEGTVQYITLMIAGITAVAFVPAAVSVTQDVVHPGLRAISLSICVIIQHVLGSSLGPIFVGMVSDRYDIKIALTFLPLFTLIAGILFFAGSFFYERDCDRVEKIELQLEDQV